MYTFYYLYIQNKDFFTKYENLNVILNYLDDYREKDENKVPLEKITIMSQIFDNDDPITSIDEVGNQLDN